MLTTNKEVIVSLIRKIKKDYCNNLDSRRLLTINFFGNMLNHCLRKKSTRSIKITLVEDNSILENNGKIAKTCNNFFTSAASNLNIPPFVNLSVEIDHI